ncbi:MAG: DUF4301 family protein [Alloprevotella sp.]|nr:DUF4301 family protein [Alloprevotella sp.]
MLTPQDYAQLAQKHISEQQLNEQLEHFKQGFPYLKLAGPAEVGTGICRFSDDETARYVEAWEKAVQTLKTVKFVPASGAASRMFKDLFAYVDADYEHPTTDFEKAFFAHIRDFAFFEPLNDACKRLNGGRDIAALVADGEEKAVVKVLLTSDGLNYGQLPKGLLLFHRYDAQVRTAAEEHLVEGALYAKQGDGRVCIHFTVSAEHQALFGQLIEAKRHEYEQLFGVKFDISFSQQKSSTDTVAATADNEPFRNDDGSLLFRPGGHGALIENLNDIDADIVFIKNIDNVVPDRLKQPTTDNKKFIAGLLAVLREKTFGYLRILESGRYTDAQIDEMAAFLQKDLCCELPDGLTRAELPAVLREKFNRPLRVCGMVKNVGEPGGGPFRVVNADGTVSLQILESSQIDLGNEQSRAFFEKGTHFNPVDLVCCIKDYKGQPFHLPDFVDPATGFISHKSKAGRELKALELPGLWNGAMSNWNTVFVEVPLITFNPVKTVNDLVRNEHQ